MLLRINFISRRRGIKGNSGGVMAAGSWQLVQQGDLRQKTAWNFFSSTKCC
jgi:hypothetical protein